MPNHRNIYISLAASMSKTGKFQLTPLVMRVQRMVRIFSDDHSIGSVRSRTQLLLKENRYLPMIFQTLTKSPETLFHVKWIKVARLAGRRVLCEISAKFMVW